MKLNKVEKIIIAVILLGLILVGGTFLFVVPSFKEIEKQSLILVANLEEKAELDTKLERLNTIDADIETQRKDAIKYEGSFYPDLTSYEASELAMAYMKSAGLEATTIELTNLSTRELSLDYFFPAEVEYDLKEYSKIANSTTDEETLLDGEFMDGNKKYSITASSVTDVVISDENGIIDPGKYTDTMKKMYKAAVCRLVSESGTSQTVAAIQAPYEVTGKFSDYMKFIDHIYSLDRATMFEQVPIPMTVTIEEDEDSEAVFVTEGGTISTGSESNGEMLVVEDDTEVKKELTIIFLCVEPMESLSTVDADGTSIVVNQRPAVY